MVDIGQQVDDLIANSNHISKWVEEQPKDVQASHAQSIFTKLYGNAAQPRSVSGNACVKLCSFVQQASKSHSPELRLWSFSRDVVMKLFNFYVEWNESDNHRSMRLVLDLLPQLMRRNPDETAAQGTKAIILDTLVSIITGKSAKPLAKSAIKTLDHFLTKGIFTPDEIRASYTALHKIDGTAGQLESWRSFMVDLFHWMKLHFVCPTAGRLLVSLYRSLRRHEVDRPIGFNIETWNQWLLDALTEEPSLLESIKQYIFLPLFKADKGEALLFLRQMNEREAVSAGTNIDVDLPAVLQLAALETGKKVGLVEEPDWSGNQESSDETSSILLHEKVLESVLAHPSHEVRSLALSLLISSPSTTRPYSSTALDLLREHLGAYFADPETKFRNDVAAKVKDVFRRVRGAIFILKKSIPRAAAKGNNDGPAKPMLYRTNLISLPEAQLVHCLAYHEAFLTWYIKFLCGELTPTASYQRHIAALKAMGYILRMEGENSKTWETADDQVLFFDLFDGEWVRALSDLIMDPFDDVRDVAAAVIKKIYADGRYRRFCLMAETDAVDPSTELAELLRRADTQARRTARADHSDGVARACQLLYSSFNDEEQRVSLLATLIVELERKLQLAESDLGRAVSEAPLHGDFASLCYTWQTVAELTFSESELQTVRALQDRLLVCCERAWAAVRSILCDDSPEGHLPQELEEVDGLDTKNVLSFSFRAVHEASNLMRAMVRPVGQGNRDQRICPSREAFERIGNLSFTQLATLRHRGAFTTVAATFATCCQLVKHVEEGQQHGETLLEQWYKGTIDAISAQVSTTRRSAGIPAMMTGILSANSSHPSFEQAMGKLMEIASVEARTAETDGSNLPQVHAYNCLKDIFKSSYLNSMGNKSEQYLPSCLELAAHGLKSELWAIRNCGLILLRSLIDCLFGTNESKETTEAGWDGKANRIAYHRYTFLPNVLLNLLKSGHEMMAPTANGSAAAESVFPALDIIRRAGPPELLRDELQVHIAKYLASPVWHVREIAARTLCSCLLHDKWLEAMSQIAESTISGDGSTVQNHAHGALLTLKFTFERLREVMPDQLLRDLPNVESLLRKYWDQIKMLNAPDIAAAYLEVANLIRALAKSENRRLPNFNLPTGSCESALLRKETVIYRVYSSYESTNSIEELQSLLFTNNLGVNSLIPCLETIPQLWTVSKTSASQLGQFCHLYVAVCFKVAPAEPRTLALQNLTEILDHLLKTNNLDSIPWTSLSELWKSLPFTLMNPALANAIIRISGCIVAALGQSKASTSTGLENWGRMMADAGLEDKDFDTRMAAAESLNSFFAIAKATCTSEAHLPALMALYDCLNDDDDEIRAVGSASATHILDQALVPLEAASRLLLWLAATFSNCPIFRAIVVDRITGGAGEVGRQLAQAMTLDDSLFVVEEQNLFVDEVRETSRWVSVFEKLAWEDDAPVLARLADWLIEGLRQMTDLQKIEDGPLGYASQPQVFAILSRVVQGAVAVMRHNPEVARRRELGQFIAVLQRRGNHTSDLLLQPLQDAPSI